ncbi:MAG: metallophosphoesterase family protein [Deltaproteobacteria bacterium]|nr:metallophosphoesterase family protein [Deltaproteobacteria bacterium]
MKLLLIGDIHANYPALRAIEQHVHNIRFDKIINTGDLTVYSTFPNETIEWFRQNRVSISILGNTDKRILRILKGKKLKKPKKDEKRLMYFWTSENLSAENIRFLHALPKKAELRMNRVRIGIFHGSFFKANEALMPDTPKSRFKELARSSPYQVHIMGHSHIPFYKCINGIHFINPGSVGRMFDGDPRTSFAKLEISTDGISVRHFRIPYAVDEVVDGLKKYRLPAIYADMFRQGKKLN